jgi:NDP-sugar pyrophosphorylase family protein
MVLRPDTEGIWGGSLATDPRTGTLATFLGRSRADAEPGPAMMFTGVHVIQPRFIDRVPPTGEQCIVRTAYRQLFDEARGIDAHTHAGYWWEHSTPERYLQGIANVLDGRASLAWAERPVIGVDPTATIAAGVELDARIFVGPGAMIGAGAKLGPHVQIGAGAVVAPGLQLERAAVWPGARLDHDLIDGVQI